MLVSWFELYGTDVAIDEEGREWIMVVEAQVGSRSIARVRTYQPGKGLIVGTVIDRNLINEILCTEADLIMVERMGPEGILAAERLRKRINRVMRRASAPRRRRLPRCMH